jgi:hypothetical protein
MAEDFFDRLAKGTPPAATGGGDFFDQLSKAPPPKAASVPLATMDTRKGLPTMRDNAPVPRKVGFEALPSLEQVDKYMGVAPGQSLLDGRQIISRSLHAAKDGLGLVDRGARAVVGDDAVNAISDPANLMIPGIGQLGAALKMGSSVTKTRVAPTVARIAEQAPLTAATGAAIAAKKLSPVVQKVQAAAKSVARGPEQRFIDRQRATNKNLNLTGGMFRDLLDKANDPIKFGTDGKRLTPKARAEVNIKTAGALGRGNYGRFKEYIANMGLPKEEVTRLGEALDNGGAHLRVDQIDALRGSVAGDAVADALTKTKLLEEYTSQAPDKVGKLLSGISTLGSLAAGLHFGGPLVGAGAGAIGAIASPVVKRLWNKVTETPASLEASRLSSLDKATKNAPRYVKAMDGPDPSIASSEALKNQYEAFQRNLRGEAEAKAAGAKTDASTKAAFGDAFPNAGIRDPKVRVDPTTGASTAVVARLKALEPKSSSALDAFDKKMAAADRVDAKVTDARTTAQAKDLMATTRGPIDDPYRPTAKQTLANFKRETGFDPAKVDSKLASFDAALDTPLPPPVVKVPKTKALSAAEQGMADNIAKGIPGNTGTQAYFGKYVLGSEAAPVSAADAVRAAEAVAGDYPQFAGEIAKFKGGYNTVKGFKQVVGPAMRKYLETDGTLAKVQAASDATNKLAEVRKAAETVRTAQKKTTGAKVTEAPPVTPEAPVGATAAPQGKGGMANFGIGNLPARDAGKAANIAAANQLKTALFGHKGISNALIESGELDGVMERLRDLQTKDVATEYLNSVLKDLNKNDLASSNELDLIRSHGEAVIDIKKHASQEAMVDHFEPRTRGRPRK